MSSLFSNAAIALLILLLQSPRVTPVIKSPSEACPITITIKSSKETFLPSSLGVSGAEHHVGAFCHHSLMNRIYTNADVKHLRAVLIGNLQTAAAFRIYIFPNSTADSICPAKSIDGFALAVAVAHSIIAWAVSRPESLRCNETWPLASLDNVYAAQKHCGNIQFLFGTIKYEE